MTAEGEQMEKASCFSDNVLQTDLKASLKMLMDRMHLRDRQSFVNNYFNPNLSEGYIAMLYPEIPNHPMQSHYLTNKGRELLKQL